MRRDASESVLSSLAAWAEDDGVGSTIASLVGPPGLGKTMLLRVFESRVLQRSGTGSHACSVLYLPYAGLPPIELTDWIYGLLGRPRTASENSVPDSSPTRTGEKSDRASLKPLLELASSSDLPFFLLIDDADSMPPQTQRALVSELPSERSPLRVVLAMNDDAKASRMLAGFDSASPRIVGLRAPMNQNETDHYVVARLRWAGADSALIEALDSETKHRLFALSGGNPQALHRIAGAHFDAEGKRRPGALDQKQRREDWMGRPFEDESLEPDS